MLSVVADSFCFEVPISILKFDLAWINPELVLSSWVSMEGRDQIVAFWVAIALVIIVSLMFMVWTYEMKIIIKLWYHVII
jgi:hypothetical protein